MPLRLLAHVTLAAGEAVEDQTFLLERIISDGLCVRLLLMKNKFTKLFWGLWSVGVTFGLVLSIQQNTIVNDLKEKHRDVKAKSGLLKIDDPTKVYVTPVTSPVVPIVLQDERVRVWQYQVHLPIGYGVCVIEVGGPMTKDGIHNRGGTSSSMSSPRKEALRGLWTFCLYEKDGQWKLSSSGPSSSGQISLHEFDIDSVDDLIVTTISPEAGRTVEIAPDVFFNLLRIRTVQKAQRRQYQERDKELYPGVAVWIGPKASRPAFDAIRNGSENPGDLSKVILND